MIKLVFKPPSQCLSSSHFQLGTICRLSHHVLASPSQHRAFKRLLWEDIESFVGGRSQANSVLSHQIESPGHIPTQTHIIICRPSLRGPDEVLFALRAHNQPTNHSAGAVISIIGGTGSGIGIRECDTYTIHVNANIDSIG
jgi:hypothetical protein